MIRRCYSIPCFQFQFLFRNNGIREQLYANGFRRSYGNFFFSKVSFLKYLITAMFKILSQQLRGTLTTAFEINLTTEDFTDMDQHRCRACTQTFDLLLYVSLCLKQTQFLNLIQCRSKNFCHNIFTFLSFDVLCILKFIQYLHGFFHKSQ